MGVCIPDAGLEYLSGLYKTNHLNLKFVHFYRKANEFYNMQLNAEKARAVNLEKFAEQGNAEKAREAYLEKFAAQEEIFTTWQTMFLIDTKKTYFTTAEGNLDEQHIDQAMTH